MKSHPLIALLTLSLSTVGLVLVTRWAGGASAYPLASATRNDDSWEDIRGRSRASAYPLTSATRNDDSWEDIRGRSRASAYPLTSAACNRPAADMPTAPDGCPNYVPIAPPPAPIPPPCITDAQVVWWDEDDAAVTELTIYVDHPELGQGVRTYTKLTRIQHSAFSIPNSEWELVDADWEVSCGKDEGPMVWTLFEVLNAGRWDALSIYTAPLPAEYMAVLRELAGLRNFTYLPYLEVQP